MTKPLRVKTSDCSYEILVRIALRCGFIIFEGKKHCKVKTQSDQFITTIPRHSRLKRETAKAIVEAFKTFGANIDYS
jgi:hypothetical protein